MQIHELRIIFAENIKKHTKMENNTQMLPINLLEVNKGQIEGLPKNPRFIRDERFAALVKSIKDAPEMLHLRELLVVKHGKKYVTIGGNMRLRACLELGFTEVPCKVLAEDTPTAKLREYAIKDNNGFGEDDWDVLANEWDAAELQEWGMELPTEWGVDADDFGDEFSLPDGDKSGIVTVSLMMSAEQAEIVKEALKEAEGTEEYKFMETFGNSNKSGNAAYLIISQWANARK